MKNKETLEEAAKNYAKIPLSRDIDTEERYFNDAVREYDAFSDGAKWQQQKMYSEEEIIDLLLARDIELNSFEGIDKAKEWFEQFKKK